MAYVIAEPPLFDMRPIIIDPPPMRMELFYPRPALTLSPMNMLIRVVLPNLDWEPKAKRLSRRQEKRAKVKAALHARHNSRRHWHPKRTERWLRWMDWEQERWEAMQ